MKGKLIVIDGSDGSGKATQTRELVKRLTEEGKVVRTLDFPQYDNNFFGRLLHKALRSEYGNFVSIDPHIACPIFAADRFESKPKLEKWLSEGKIIILDRYVSANQIHQGGKIKDEIERREFMGWLAEMEYDIFKIPKPDLVVFLDVPVDAAQKLIKNKDKDSAEKDLEYLENSRECALWLAEQNDFWEKIDCAPDGENVSSIEEIHEKLYSLVNETINQGEN